MRDTDESDEAGDALNFATTLEAYIVNDVSAVSGTNADNVIGGVNVANGVLNLCDAADGRGCRYCCF